MVRQEVIKSRGLQEEVGMMLKEARKKKGLTINQLSLMSGVSRRSITNIERGINFSIENLYRISLALRMRLVIDLI